VRALAIVVAALLLGSSACGDGQARTADLVHVRVDGIDGIHDPVRAGDALVSIDAAYRPAVAQALTSIDAGETWEAIALPGTTEPVRLWLPQDLDGWASIVARDDVDGIPAGAVYVWTTTDGRTWHGGRVADDAPAFVQPDVHRVGDRLLTTFTSDRQLRVLTSDDAGASWQAARVPELGLGEEQSAHLPFLWEQDGALAGLGDFRGTNPPAHRFVLTSSDGGRTWVEGDRCDPGATQCPRPTQTAGELTVRDGEVSLDGGATWVEAEVEERAGLDDLTGLAFDEVVQHGDGWMATAGLYVPSDVEFGFLLASDDGRTWRHVADDPCIDAGGSRPNSRFRGPVVVDDIAYVTYSCVALTDAVEGVILRVAPGEDAQPIDGTEIRDGTFGAPHLVGDLLVVAVQRGEISELLRLPVR